MFAAEFLFQLQHRFKKISVPFGSTAHHHAIGIGQLLPSTAGFVAGVLIGAPLDPYVADDNIRMSARFLAHLVSLTNGDVNMALAGYYQGLTSVRRDGMKATTAAYVNVVLALQARF